MAHHKSALKRVRQTIKRNARNRHMRSALRTHLKNYHALITAKDAEAAEKNFSEVQKQIDKAVTKGILHRNAGARTKARLAAAVKKIKAA